MYIIDINNGMAWVQTSNEWIEDGLSMGSDSHWGLSMGWFPVGPAKVKARKIFA